MNKVVLISIDALGDTEWDKIKNLGNFKKFIDNGIYSRNLLSIFPTSTYPVHTTITTGVYPGKHGVIHNKPLQPFVPSHDQRWYRFHSEIKSPTIYDYVKDSGGRVASFMWPVSAKTSMRYNMPEVVTVKNENPKLQILKNGSIPFIIEMELRFAKHRVNMTKPHLDEYVTDCVVHTIKHKKPELTMIHYLNLDAVKHNNLLDSKAVDDELIRVNDYITKILEVVDDDTTVIMMGDHGHIEIDYSVKLNNLFFEAGLIYLEQGEYKYNAYMQSSGGSAYLHAKDKVSTVKAFKVLSAAKDSGGYGIEKIYDNADIIRMGISDNIIGGVEAIAGYAFNDDISGETIVDLKAKGITRATHGYHPDRENYKCLFMALGCGIKAKGEIKSMNMVDVAPTVIRLMDLGEFACDGFSIV